MRIGFGRSGIRLSPGLYLWCCLELLQGMLLYLCCGRLGILLFFGCLDAMVRCCFMSALEWDLFCGDESRVITSKIFGSLDFLFSFDVDKEVFGIVGSVCIFLLGDCSLIFVGVCVMIRLFLRVFRNLFMSSSVGMYFCCCLIFVFWSFFALLGWQSCNL